jgi:hypothetical protein
VHEWQDCIAVPWFDDPAGLGRPLVAEGPSSWQHAGAERARTAREISTRDARVSGIQADDDSISFRVSRPGVPVLIKTSYFPNWEAHGARGPYRATPNFMVVVPTRHDVRLTYATTSAEWLGRIGTLAGLAGLVGLVWWSRRYRAAGEIQRGSPDRDA